MKPSDLVLSRVPDKLEIQQIPRLASGAGPTEFRPRYISCLSNMLSAATKRLQDAKTRYKLDHNNWLRRPLSDYAIGDYMLEKGQSPLPSKEKSDANNT